MLREFGPKFLLGFLMLTGVLGYPNTVWAQAPVNEATISAETATPAATIVERVTERRSDITEPQGETKGKLERFVEAQERKPLAVTNFLKQAIFEAVSRGVPANTIVLVLLFPAIAAIIGAGRHLIGLRGFGIFVPAVLSVALVATGLITGMLLFLVILAMATLARHLLKFLKLQYLPRMALLLWFVAVGLFAALFAAPFLHLEGLVNINIFPILILILLAENFIEAQIGKSQREAWELTIETLVLAIISSLVLSLEVVQLFALRYPELLVLGVALFNIGIGRYVGLRFSEYLKYRKLLD